MHSQLLRRAVVALAAASLTLAGSPAVAGAAGADPASGRQNPSHADHGRATGWYLALGDSLAAGLQPGVGEDRAGGYVGAVLDAVRTTRPKTRLVNLACSGETSTTLVDGGLCSYHKGSQLAEAEHFLHAHGRKTRLVTLTIGSNDVTPCLRGPAAELGACVQQALGVLADNLKRTLAEVRAEAPQARLVVTNYYNPYLALWFDNPGLASATTALQRQLNDTIAAVTTAFGGGTADVAEAFRSYDATPLGDGVPTNVAVICADTYMCAIGNIHPNDAGYALIASAVLAKL